MRDIHAVLPSEEVHFLPSMVSIHHISFLNPINSPGTNPNIVAIGKWGQYTYDVNKSADCAQAKIVNG
ncbi:MAG: hypothetical protein WA220_12320 [Candidatus Nitrosopolaris sp.]